MKAYRTFSRITQTNQVILSEVPFEAGQEVEIVILSANGETRAERLRDLKTLLRDTQALAQVQSITEDDISREIEAYRNGK